MARKKTPPQHATFEQTLSERLRQLRIELFGEDGGPECAERLNVPVRHWYHYESGVTVPAEILLRFIELTNANPSWLLHGTGDCYGAGGGSTAAEALTPEELIRRGLEKLEKRNQEKEPPKAGKAPGGAAKGKLKN